MILSYARVSTTEQASEHATSLAEQERKNRALATMRGADAFDVVCYTDPGISGSIPLAARPAGGKMLDEAVPGDTIVANKMDRLFRSASDALTTAEMLAEKKIDLVLLDMGTTRVTQNGAAKMFFSIMAAVAEFERERIAERMTDGRRCKRERHGHTGGSAPYGFRIVGRGRTSALEEVPEEQEIIRQATEMKRGRMPWTRIVKILEQRGLMARSGEPFKIIQVQRFVNRALSAPPPAEEPAP